MAFCLQNVECSNTQNPLKMIFNSILPTHITIRCIHFCKALKLILSLLFKGSRHHPGLWAALVAPCTNRSWDVQYIGGRWATTTCRRWSFVLPPVFVHSHHGCSFSFTFPTPLLCRNMMAVSISKLGQVWLQVTFELYHHFRCLQVLSYK